MRLARAGLIAAVCLAAASSASAQALRDSVTLPVIGVAPTPGRTILVDDFENLGGWSARPADGVELAIRPDAGRVGHAMRLDFRFVKGGGYVVVHKDLSLDLPGNYRFAFRIRGESPVNNLEFKLIDSTGENVWWSNQRDFHFPARWDSVRLAKRKIGFAWGPQGGGELRHVSAIEFAVTAGNGGTGSVWIDDLTLQELPPAGVAPPMPIASATSVRPGHAAAAAIDGDSATTWRSRTNDTRPAITLDLGVEREFGGLVIDWAPGRQLRDYDVEFSNDRSTWRRVRAVRGSNGGRDYLYLPESESRYVRLRTAKTMRAGGCAIREITIEPLAWSASMNDFFLAIAKDAPRGSYPRAFSGEQSYWTVVGNGQGRTRDVALLNEDGMLEVGKGAFSIEPFLYVDHHLVGWSDVRSRQSMHKQWPVPWVTWQKDSLELTITAIAMSGGPTRAHYHLYNRGFVRRRGSIFLALRPFQVNPPAQFLNAPGGVARIRSIVRDGPTIRVNDERELMSLTPVTNFGAAAFDEGDVVEWLKQGRVPPGATTHDAFESASAALSYAFNLAPGADLAVVIALPTPGVKTPLDSIRTDVASEVVGEIRTWQQLGRVAIDVPDTDVIKTLRTQLGDMFINRDSVALQPGSRAYARTWIRDGALMCAALLRMGQADAVRDFIEWFAPYQYADGKVPCCVDWRGSDPVPEHDSAGEFIYLIAEYSHYTVDLEFAERYWPAVARAAAYLDSLRQERRTPEWRAPGKEEFFGLLPPSISHEGYSAKPMHSYWDDFFALRGLKDAAWLAEVLGHPEDARRLATIRNEFQHDLSASIAAAMRAHHIDYIPGCADLGDFDATSTTIALDPVAADDAVPHAALERTFEKYYGFFRDRRDGREAWEAFTPYEMRNIGAFVRLGWRDRANELLDYFMRYRRPAGWNEWAEVVWHDERAPKFIGDMPHTWVGSDFIRSVLDMFAYSREPNDVLVIGAGVPWSWVSRDPGVVVRGLHTRRGFLDCTMRATGDVLEVKIGGPLYAPSGEIVLSPPHHIPFRSATINSVPATLTSDGSVVIRSLPARVVLRP